MMPMILKKITRIIRSNLYGRFFKKDLDWVRERKSICTSCPHMSRNIEKKKGARYWILNILNFKEDFCNICGCGINQKTTEELEECPIGKWGQVEY